MPPDAPGLQKIKFFCFEHPLIMPIVFLVTDFAWKNCIGGAIQAVGKKACFESQWFEK